MPLALAEVLREHWPRFARAHAPRLAAAHHRAARAALSCRTPALGGRLWQCACHAHARHYVSSSSTAPRSRRACATVSNSP